MSSGLWSEVLVLFLAVNCQTKLNMHIEFSKSVWAQKHCDTVECWPDCKLTALRILNILKGGIYGPIIKLYCQTMIQESTWELCDISFKTRLRRYLLRKMPVLSGMESLFNVAASLATLHAVHDLAFSFPDFLLWSRPPVRKS